MEPSTAKKRILIPGGGSADQGSLLALALLSLLVGTASGLVGAAFRLSLDQADRWRGAVIAWAHERDVCRRFAGYRCLRRGDRRCRLAGSALLTAGFRQRYPSRRSGPERRAATGAVSA